MTRRPVTLAIGLALLAAVTQVVAGGPRAVNGQGLAMQWDTTGPVVWNADPGPLGLLQRAAAPLRLTSERRPGVTHLCVVTNWYQLLK